LNVETPNSIVQGLADFMVDGASACWGGLHGEVGSRESWVRPGAPFIITSLENYQRVPENYLIYP
jgi:hypothetical protein